MKQIIIGSYQTFGVTAQNDPTGIRTPVAAVKGRCPRPLDDGAVTPQRMRG